MDWIEAQPWLGNVRELKNFLERSLPQMNRTVLFKLMKKLNIRG